jgi:hypothetical protein
MKRILTTIAILLAAIAANAQGNHGGLYIEPEVVRIVSMIFTVALFMGFILTVLKRVLEYRLKNKIVDKGISENISSSILETKASENKNINIKWFAILAGLGIGLAIVNYTQPLGLHSLAIMSFSISLSFLGYYFFIRQTENK